MIRLAGEKRLYSHPEFKGFEGIYLSDHLLNVASSCKRIVEDLNLDLRLISKGSLAELAFRIGLLHDLGKASTYFQKKLSGDDSQGQMANHSLISAIIAYQNIGKMKELPTFTAPLAFKIIQRHHGDLDSFEELDRLKESTLLQTVDIYKDICSNVRSHPLFEKLLADNGVQLNHLSKRELEKLLEDIAEFDFSEQDQAESEGVAEENSMELLIIANLLFSILITKDKMHAARLDQSWFEDSIEILDMNPDPYKNAKFKAAKDTPVNRLRTEFYKRCGRNEIISSDRFQYTITAPTGIGKTLSCMNFVSTLQSKLERKRRIIYCLPFTSIIDQNYEVYQDVFQHNNPEYEEESYKYIIRHHHLQDYFKLSKDEPDYDYWDYVNDLLIVESWVSAMIVSTFVQLFHTLIGNRNKTLKKLHNIINSIIILDEVQNVSPDYYYLLRVLFKVLAERFKTYIVLCTATRPFLFESTSDGDSDKELSDLTYFQNPVVNRVKMTYEPDKTKLTDYLETIVSMKYDNLLLILNTKAAVKQAYETLSEEYGDKFEIFCLSTSQIPLHRSQIIEEVIQRLKNKEKVILISTQLVEAGVDISFKLVIRDFAPLDSVVQTAGRCNRSGEYGILGGEMRLVRLTDDNEKEYAHWIYDKYLLQQTDAVLGKRPEWCSKDFFELSNQYFGSLQSDALSKMHLAAIANLNYDGGDRKGEIPVSDFKLIVDNYQDTTLFVLVNDEAQHIMAEYLKTKKALKVQVGDNEGRDSLTMDLKRLRNRLANFQISLHHGALSTQKEQNPHLIASLGENEYYVEKEHVDTIYSKDMGFKKEVEHAHEQWQF